MTNAASATSVFPGSDPPELIACTICDALHEIDSIPHHGRLKCRRCGHVMLRDVTRGMDRLIASAVSMVVLVISAVFFPFLELNASGLSSKASLLDTALAFKGGLTGPLVVALMMLIVVVPVLRACALIYALLPLRLGRSAFPGAKPVFAAASEMRPWSMAEIFIIGVAVALVKVGGMATVGFGPAFWQLSLIVVIVVLESTSFCERSLWRMIDKAS